MNRTYYTNRERAEDNMARRKLQRKVKIVVRSIEALLVVAVILWVVLT